jgi:UDP-N-acetylmuramoyl-tripeptide--D-alanyl-D-alanine ligase
MERYWKDRLYGPASRRLELAAARGYRSLLNGLGPVRFIGVTGSCAKTTTTELIAAILAQEGRVRKGSHENTVPYLAKTILGTRPGDRFCVSEVSAHGPGAMDEAVRLMRFHIAVVTRIGRDHYSSFRNLESTAAEKGKLVEAIPAHGAAVLNADDPRVMAMGRRTRARVITYGRSAQAEVRAENVSCIWPQRMSLDVCTQGRRHRVQTRLLGEHWTCSILAAVSTGLAAGVPLEVAIRAVEGFDPLPHRMSPHPAPGGVTFVCDTWKAPLWSMATCLDFMRQARAERKIIVIGWVCDTSKGFADRYKAILEQALDAADKIAFVGEHASAALRGRSQGDRVVAFGTLRELHAFLRAYLRPGDLVLLKGTGNQDHLRRIQIAWTGPMACWRDDCRRKCECLSCRLLHGPPEPGGTLANGVSNS